MLKKSKLLEYLLGKSRERMEISGRNSISCNDFMVETLRVMQLALDNNLPSQIGCDEVVTEIVAVLMDKNHLKGNEINEIFAKTVVGLKN